jgi:hypothetical protein
VGPETLIGLLAEPERMRVFAALVLGARTAADVARAADLDQRAVGRALQRLEAGGLVERAGDGYQPVLEVFKQIARTTAPPAKTEEHGYADKRVEAVLRTFVRDGRLIGLPAQAGRRHVVLEHMVQSFEPGRSYTEAEVNAILRAWTEGGSTDHVALRRYLVDAGLLTRDGASYWRSGGWVDVLDEPTRPTGPTGHSGQTD